MTARPAAGNSRRVSTSVVVVALSSHSQLLFCCLRCSMLRAANSTARGSRRRHPVDLRANLRDCQPFLCEQTCRNTGSNAGKPFAARHTYLPVLVSGTRVHQSVRLINAVERDFARCKDPKVAGIVPIAVLPQPHIVLIEYVTTVAYVDSFLGVHRNKRDPARRLSGIAGPRLTHPTRVTAPTPL
jgi:hypothetical protein